MKKETKDIIAIIALALGVTSFVAGILFGTGAYANRDKFKVGDCVADVYETEFKRSVTYHDILAVGKEMYKTNQKPDDYEYYINAPNNGEWKFRLNDYSTVDKSLCVAKVHTWR